MLDFCAEHGIAADVEVMAIADVQRAFERMERGQVRYRSVIDVATLGDGWQPHVERPGRRRVGNSYRDVTLRRYRKLPSPTLEALAASGELKTELHPSTVKLLRQMARYGGLGDRVSVRDGPPAPADPDAVGREQSAGVRSGRPRRVGARRVRSRSAS